MPADSSGFCVAITKKGSGNECVCFAIVTVRSSITSSNEDCVLGTARLISSTNTIFAKMGPNLVLNPIPSHQSIQGQ